MRYHELTEDWYTTIKFDDINVSVSINPTKREMTTLLMKSAGKVLRALLTTDNSLLVWDAYYATHTDIIDEIPRSDYLTGYLYLHPDHIDFNDMNYHANNEGEYPARYAYRPIVWRYYNATLAHPSIRSFYGSNPKIIGFDDQDFAGLGLPRNGFEITRDFMERHVAPETVTESLITEASDAPLYHATSFKSARAILASGVLRPDGLLGDEDEEDWFDPISMTRDPFYRFMDHPVQFMFSGRILKQQHRIKPFNWFDSALGVRYEAEEAVFAKEVPITLATAMILLPSEKKKPKNIEKAFRRQGDELAEIARSKGIEVVDWRDRKLPMRPATRLKNRLPESLTEASDAPLYHATSLGAAKAILDDGLLKGSIAFNAFDDSSAIQPISMSRDPNFNFMQSGVQFVFDARRLGQRFRITPHDWFNKGRGFGKRREEREERVYAPTGIPLSMATAMILQPMEEIVPALWRLGDALKAKAEMLGLEVIDRREPPRMLTERQADSDIAFHGTSSKFLPSILKKGLLPMPPWRVYGGDFTAYEGVYFSDTFTVAAYRGHLATDIFGGNTIVVCAKIDPTTLAGDEDAMRDFLDALDSLIGDYIDENDLDEDDPDDRMEASAHAFYDQFGVEAPREFFKLIDGSVEELSPQYREIVDRVMRRVGPTRSGGHYAARDFRSVAGARPEDIICIIEIRGLTDHSDPTYIDDDAELRVLYGKVPPELRSLIKINEGIEAWRNHPEDDFLGSPKITSMRNARLLRPKALLGMEKLPREPFLNRFEAVFTRHGAAVFDGDKVIASYNFGDTLVVDPAYRRQGIGEELVYRFRTRYPNSPPARYRTKASQALQKKVWQRITSELKNK